MKRTIKSNLWIIGISLMIDIVVIFVAGVLKSAELIKIIIPIAGSVVFASLWVILFSIIGIIRKQVTNKALRQLPYNFNYLMEYEIYNRVGKNKKDKIAKQIHEQGINIPNRYSLWKDGLLQRYSSLKNNEDFFHFLKYKIRDIKKQYDEIAIIVTPLEIGIMTVYMTDYITNGGSMWGVVLSAAFLLVILMIEMNKSKNEIAYAEDIIEVLCPDFYKETYSYEKNKE